MLNREEIRELGIRAVDRLGTQLRMLRLSRGISILKVSEISGISLDEIDRIENWNINILNLENIIRLAAFYDKRIFIDLISLKDEKDC